MRAHLGRLIGNVGRFFLNELIFVYIEFDAWLFRVITWNGDLNFKRFEYFPGFIEDMNCKM